MAADAEIDAAFEAAGLPVKLDPALLGPEWLPNGVYTLALPCGTHRTFRLYTQQKGKLAGRRIIGLLIGPDNTKDYEDFAFVTPKGFQVWKRFLGMRQAEYAVLIWDIAGGTELDGHTLSLSKKCIVCNRPLTTPESLADGIGPVCSGRAEGVVSRNPKLESTE